MANPIQKDKTSTITEPEMNSHALGAITKEAPFDHILNFRDVGKTINELLGEKKVAENKIYRSARPDDASPKDRARLTQQYGIKTIIDLRTKTEHVNRLEKRNGDLKAPAILQTNTALAEPLQIPGIEYKEINMNGRGFERGLLFQLKPWSIVRLVWLMLLGYRMEAISILGREVMQPRGLIGLGKDSLDFCGTEIAEILTLYADPQNQPILIHCTQGKDRTGLIISLLLLMLKIPLPAIDYEYRMSEEELAPELPARLQEISSIGLSPEFAACPAGWIPALDVYLQEKYGGVSMYLRVIGIRAETEERIVALLRA